MAGITVEYVSSLSFTISGTDYTNDFTQMRRVKAMCGDDGDKYFWVDSSSFSDPYTTVTLISGTGGNLTSNLTEVYFSQTDGNKFYLNGEVDTISGSLNDKISTKMTDLVDDTSPQLGGDLDINNHNINYGTVLTVNGTYKGEIMTITIDDASTTFGNPLYCADDFHYERCDADSDLTMPCRMLALESGAGSKKVLIKGQICNTSWDWSSGTVWVSLTTGEITQTLPSETGDQVQEIGYALSADTIFFDPVSIVAEVE